MPPFDATLPHYEAEALEGLEDIASAEVQRLRPAFAAHQQPGALRFGFGGDPALLDGLRSVTAVYAVRHFAVPRPKALLGHQQFAALRTLADDVIGGQPRGSFATLRLSTAGEDSAVMQRLRDDLAAELGLAPTTAEGDLLVRVRPGASGGWEALVRLTPRPLVTRPWRVCNYPGALNACVAHAMMVLTNPNPADRVLNLACGSGTLLIERLALGAARSAVGCDPNVDAVACAERNLEAAHMQHAAQIEYWDATDLPLPDASVDVVCADLPFGQLIGSHRQNQTLYPALFAEATRVAAPGARMALFSHEVRLLEHTIARFPAWNTVESRRVRVSGMAPLLVVLHRR